MNAGHFEQLSDCWLSEQQPATYYRTAAAQARRLQVDATTPRVKQYLDKMIAHPSVPMKVRHLSRGIFRLEGAEGSSHSCPCSRSRLIQQVAPSRSVCADRRLYRRHALRHPNSPIARGDGRSLPRTSCAS